MTKEVYKNLGTDVMTSQSTALKARLGGLDGMFPERVVIENTHEVPEYSPRNMPYYNVTFEYEKKDSQEKRKSLDKERNRLKENIKNYEETFPPRVAVNTRKRLKIIEEKLAKLESTSSKYNLNELAQELHQLSVEKGFYHDQQQMDYLGPWDSKLRSILKRSLNSEKLLLIISEVTEIVEELRKPNPDEDKIAEEYADVLIRLLDSVAANDVDIDGALEKKRKKNKRREYMNGGKRF